MGMTTLAGKRIYEDSAMTLGPFEDWSKVRSPGRARRRRAKHRQNIRLYWTPNPDLLTTRDMIIGHPTTIRKLRASLQQEQNPS